MPGACPNSTVHCTHTLYTYIFNPNCTKILSSRVSSSKGGENSESERDTKETRERQKYVTFLRAQHLVRPNFLLRYWPLSDCGSINTLITNKHQKMSEHIIMVASFMTAASFP